MHRESTFDAMALLQGDQADAALVQGRNIRVIGIDLGTTNSTVAEVLATSDLTSLPPVRCLEIEQFTADGDHTHLLVPSVIALFQGREIVGAGAKRLLAHASENGLVPNQTVFFECKSDMGIRKTYHKAPEGYRSAAEVGGRLLAFLHQAAAQEDPKPVDRTVITVPASYQVAQRNDTIQSARLAGIDVQDGDLLDEPVAAFIDYVVRNQGFPEVQPSETKRLMVFDFGGGTCDVAVFGLRFEPGAARPTISPMAVSRYHRLGGSDIDRAVLYDALIPQLIEQNGLDSFSLSYHDKKRIIEPAFIGVAEALKTGLCRELRRLQAFGDHGLEQARNLVKTQPGVYRCLLQDGRELRLQSPELSGDRFEEIIAPFVDPDILYAEETEYRMWCSVFAPISDTLDRSGLDADGIDYCLLVGGSSLIPHVEEAIRQFFKSGNVLTYPDYEEIQTAVARGAAYHALSLALFDRPIVQPVCHDAISLKTKAGPLMLIPKGAHLPFPADGGFAQNTSLRVPEMRLTESLPLRLEVVAGDEQRSAGHRVWDIKAPVNKGDELRLEYRYDANQSLDLRMSLTGGLERGHIDFRIEKPFAQVVNPQATKLKIDELEESIRVGAIAVNKQPRAFKELAGYYAELKQYEKALEYLSSVLRKSGRPDATVLNQMASYRGEMGDHERAEKLYTEAAAANSSWGGPWFNLALSQERRKQYVEAIASVTKAIDVVDDGRVAAYRALRARLHARVGNTRDRDRDLQEALKVFGEARNPSSFELSWYAFAAGMAGDAELEAKVRAEQRRMRKATGSSDGPEGVLPELTQSLQRRA